MIKKLLTLVFLLPAYFAFGQDTTYLNSKMQEITFTPIASYYRVVEHSSPTSKNAVENIYYISGQLYSQKNYSNYEEKKDKENIKSGMKMGN